ncbi:MAG: phosphatase PAP2 family protein [Ignavibacteriales bacterium]|nr:phosphatase PAP2 family protein [Ignavibacteriales bacterium]
MIDFLHRIDLAIFYFFNHTLSSGALDKFFTHITEVKSWTIAYIILIGILLTKGGRRGRIAVVGIALLIAVVDMTGHRILKEIFERARPCNALPDVLTPAGARGTFSFPSNHALNNFAAATYFYLLYPNLKWALFISAALVALSRVYLGLHYPSDIIAGAAIGSAFGYGFAWAHRRLERTLDERRNDA